jgi:hypothetical protein
MQTLRSSLTRVVGGYDLPCAFIEEDRIRLENRDVPNLGDASLIAERLRVQQAYARAEGRRLNMAGLGVCQILDVAAWLHMRLRALLVEERRRRGSSR